jgi:thioester reductase-like protein
MTDRVFLPTEVTGFLGKVLLEELMRRREELGVGNVCVVIRSRGSHKAADHFAREVAKSGFRPASKLRQHQRPVLRSRKRTDFRHDWATQQAR